MQIHAEARRPFPILYKYLPQRYAKGFVCRGELRLGTLHDYQDEERYGVAIGDKEEGVKVFYDNPALVTTARPETLSPVVRQFVDPGLDPSIIFDQCLFSIGERSPNCWLYCTSSRLSAQLMREFRADACVRIDDPRSFFRAIFAELARRELAGQMDVMECVYRERAQHYLAADRLPPAALKAARYSHQQEIRALFFPRNRPIQPLLLAVPEAAQYCSLMNEVPDQFATAPISSGNG